MNKIANVIYSYDAKNDDELNLIIGQQIEIIGVEEEGWWRGRIKGKIGVFPINFVQIVDNNSTADNKNITSNTRKLANIFANKSNKNSLSARNSLNSNSCNNINNVMDSTMRAKSTDLQTTDDSPNITISEIKPKLVKGVGYGDIFAVGGGLTKLKPLPSDKVITTSVTTATSATANTSSINCASANATKEILKTRGANVSYSLQKQIPKKLPPPAPIIESNQAPALPPKPINRFNPIIQQQQERQLTSTQQVREQAKVIYNYKPLNDDELALEVGDIILIIDKEIEDVGWWKGELNGKIGVFPDNFVEIIGINTTSKLDDNSKPLANNFCKNIKNNLLDKQKHSIGNNTADTSLIHAKRSKFQLSTKSLDSSIMASALSEKSPADIEFNPSPNKLKHITINRAKGPSRKPPSSISNIKYQTVFTSNLETGSSSNDETIDSKSTDDKQDNSTEIHKTPFNNEHVQDPKILNSTSTNLSLQLNRPELSNLMNIQAEIKSTPSVDNVLETQSPSSKINSRVQPTLSIDKPKVSSSTMSPTTQTTPTWMLELKKAQADKKRDIPAVISSTPVSTQIIDKTIKAPLLQSESLVAELDDTYKKNIVAEGQIKSNNNLSSNENYDKLIERISKNFKEEVNELRGEIKALKLEFVGLNELKDIIDTMKSDLKICQSAIENQKKYMKDLVNSLANERRKISLLQEELDCNLN